MKAIHTLYPEAAKSKVKSDYIVTKWDKIKKVKLFFKFLDLRLW